MQLKMTSNRRVAIEYSQTFENLLNDLINYLSQFSDEEQVIIRIETCIERFEKLASYTPEAAPISHSLLELGVTQFREFTLDDFRLVYRVINDDDATRVIGDLIVSQKQDLQQLLINYCLLHK